MRLNYDFWIFLDYKDAPKLKDTICKDDDNQRICDFRSNVGMQSDSARMIMTKGYGVK